MEHNGAHEDNVVATQSGQLRDAKAVYWQGSQDENLRKEEKQFITIWYDTYDFFFFCWKFEDRADNAV